MALRYVGLLLIKLHSLVRVGKLKAGTEREEPRGENVESSASREGPEGFDELGAEPKEESPPPQLRCWMNCLTDFMVLGGVGPLYLLLGECW